MNRLKQKLQNQALRRQRTRARIAGTAERPRLSVHISNSHVTAQIINDDSHETLAHASTIGRPAEGTMTQRAQQIGEEIAQKAKTAKIERVVFDRGAKLYHGRIKALADAARAKGLEF